MEYVVTRERQDRVRLRRASILLDQQMWLFGQDLRYEGGNLLIRYGCRRERDPANTASAYVHQPDSSSEMVLWSFGLMMGKDGQGGVFLRRFSFRPRWTPHWRFATRFWEAESLARQTSPSCESDALSGLLRCTAFWLATYEDWVLSTAGIDYRRECVERWSKKQKVAADEVAGEWRALSENTDFILA